MTVAALIPARLGATRFPAKLLANLRGKSVIRRTWEAAAATGLFDQVVVVTDSDEIFAEVTTHGGAAVKSKGLHESGTDRIAKIAATMQADIIVNIQGDEPFVQKRPLQQLLELFTGPGGDDVRVASLVQQLSDQKLIDDPNYVKVVLDLNGNALMFSRSAIPYQRDKHFQVPYLEHIGVYAFRRQTLLDFASWGPSPLEQVERIECLRFLEHGIPVKMAVTNYMGVEIDTPEDLARAEALMDANGWK